MAKRTPSFSLTLAFARFADASGHEGALTAAIVLRWAKDEAQHPDPFTWAGRVNVLRPFARFLADRDPSTVFPEDAPFGRSHRRLAPHIYTPAEVEALLAAAGRLASRGGLTPATFTTLFGLLAATGLRIPELGAERLEPVAGDGHQLRHGLQIPVGVADVDVSDVGRERHHGVADIVATCLPEYQPAADEAVSQVVDADRPVTAASDDPEFRRQRQEHASYALIANGSPVIGRQEQRRTRVHRAISRPHG